jgi:hypothetical protein
MTLVSWELDSNLAVAVQDAEMDRSADYSNRKWMYREVSVQVSPSLVECSDVVFERNHCDVTVRTLVEAVVVARVACFLDSCRRRFESVAE